MENNITDKRYFEYNNSISTSLNDVRSCKVLLCWKMNHLSQCWVGCKMGGIQLNTWIYRKDKIRSIINFVTLSCLQLRTNENVSQICFILRNEFICLKIEITHSVSQNDLHVNLSLFHALFFHQHNIESSKRNLNDQ